MRIWRAIHIFFCLCCCWALVACQPIHSEQNHATLNNHDRNLRIMTPDWGIASTLLAMGVTPVAMGDVPSYSQWVVEPALPKNAVIDLGLRHQPNAELMAGLQVDLILDNDFYQHLRPMYRQTKWQAIDLQAGNQVRATWQNYAMNTQKLGDLIGETEQARHYLQQSEKLILQQKQQFQQRYPHIKKIAVVQFANANQLRLYTENSLFYAISEQMALQLQHLGTGNAWGFQDITLTDLAQFSADTCLVVIEPFSPMLQQSLQQNRLWQQLGYGSQRCMAVLAPIWIYGGVPSLTRFAEQLNTVEFKGIV